jgi:cyclophilin family peptidyl-prolyl cis-trans isomerase
MSSGKRQRQKDQRRRIELAQAEQRRDARNRRIILVGGGVVAAVVLVAFVVLLVVHRSGSSGSASTDTTVRPTTASDYGNGPCPKLDGSSSRKVKFTSAPKLCIDPTQHYIARFTTTAGDFTVTLDAAAAPVTVNNFVVLALWHYYDGTTFHRVIPDYVVQGGDATGNPPGTGTLGYTIADEYPSSLSDYVVGSIAMANTGQPHSGSSQFFIWMGPQPLPSPTYSLFGKVTSGLDVVRQIEAGGSPTGASANPVTVKSVAIGTAAIVSQ